MSRDELPEPVRAELVAQMIPGLLELEERGAVELQRDADGQPTAVRVIDTAAINAWMRS